MALEDTEQLHLERQVALARVILLALALVAFLEAPTGAVRWSAVTFLGTYLLLAIVSATPGEWQAEGRLRIPAVVDLAALAVFLFLAPSVVAFWCVYLFVVFSLATRGNSRGVATLVIATALALVVRAAILNRLTATHLLRWLAIGAGTLVAGFGAAYLGGREREHLLRRQFLEKVTGLLQFNRGLTESIRQALGELALEFDSEQACLAIREEDLDRLFVWRVCPLDREPRPPEALPLVRADTFLADDLEITMAWEFKNGHGEGFGWDRRTGQAFRDIPTPPRSTPQELGARSLLAVTIESSGRPAGRVLLLNPAHRYTPADLRWLEQIVRHIGPPLENVFLLRHLRARAVEAERSRISRDLHDGILQTLLSLKIQLGVLRKRLGHAPEVARADLEGLQKIVQHESEELRRMVTDLRPLRIESADLKELMFGLAERFRNESGLAVDLFVEDRNLRIPDLLCREIFQIYRESLYNVKKHANASHVVVKLGQDETKVSLVVDDNGLGFSFSGRYSSEELDRLRLGPISIKERARSVGGTLTVESNPGHGARLIIEIPLS